VTTLNLLSKYLLELRFDTNRDKRVVHVCKTKLGMTKIRSAWSASKQLSANTWISLTRRQV